MHVSYECFRTREDSIKFKLEKDLVEKRLLKSETERSKLERDLRQTITDVKNVEHEAHTCHKEIMDERQRVETLSREKNTLARSKKAAQDRIKRMNRELLLSEHAKRKIERELDALTQILYEVKTHLETVEKERDKCNLTVQGLERQVNLSTSDLYIAVTLLLFYRCLRQFATVGV